MHTWIRLLLGTLSMLIAAAWLASAPLAAQSSRAADAPPQGWTPPQTPWGDPDLQGIWPSTEMVGVPLVRPSGFGERNTLTEAEFAQRIAQAERQREADFESIDVFTVDVSNAGQVGSPTSPPPHWLERGQPSRQASLIVDPPNGQIPAVSAEGQQRVDARQEARRGRRAADSWEDRSLYDRCISRGVVGSMLPVIYNNGNEIVQAPGYVVLRNEMIHEARIIPLDGRPRLAPAIRQYMGDSRGRWEGNTLVVETTNFNGRTGAGPNGNTNIHSDGLRLVERLTRIGPDVIQYEVTIDDSRTWSRPWSLTFPLKSDSDYRMFEYACHEGNLAMANILSGARAEEGAAAQRERD